MKTFDPSNIKVSFGGQTFVATMEFDGMRAAPAKGRGYEATFTISVDTRPLSPDGKPQR